MMPCAGLKGVSRKIGEASERHRLRNVGGLVVVDLIDMKSRKHQAAVYRAMKNAFGGWREEGMTERNRPRPQ